MAQTISKMETIQTAIISENLYQLRKSLDLPVKAFCAKIGVGRRTYARWESGQRIPDLERLKVIIDMFEIKDIYSFCYGDGSRNIIRLAKPITGRDRKLKKKVKIPKLVYKMI